MVLQGGNHDLFKILGVLIIPFHVASLSFFSAPSLERVFSTHSFVEQNPSSIQVPLIFTLPCPDPWKDLMYKPTSLCLLELIGSQAHHIGLKCTQNDA